MRFQLFMKEIKKQIRMVKKRKKRKADELSNPSAEPVRKKIRVQNEIQIQVPSSPPSSLSPSSHPSSLSPSSHPSSLPPSPPPSSSLSSASSSSSHNWIHDVFPSFRGEDVRSNFLSHIQKEFKRKGIIPFIDNKIERGESIGPELIRAIRGSKIAIILISRNYASSKWCLDELVEIMKCRKELGQSVMAIFYKVNPSDVKKLTGDFGKVFRKTCKGKTKEDTKGWRRALKKVATIAGYDSSTWDNEAHMIEKIAADVSKKLINSVPSSDFDNLVGMSTHMKNLEPTLCLGSNEVRMIGILGPSGIGKSTIARVLFTKHSHDFQLSVFMDDIKRRYPRLGYSEYSMQLELQNKFLSQLINEEDIKINDGGVVKDRLKDKKVLVVLDDVDHLMQLDAMAKESQWFGPGSRIIITTQDKKLLNAHGINRIYEVGFPANDEALQIFCMNAFGQKSPYDGFEKLAREIVELAGGLPLGLKVMGSYFKGMSKQDWEEELPRLRIRLDGEIESILRFSYDALSDEDQALFLHIACFFSFGQIENVETCLSETFVGVKGRLHVFAEKCLIVVVWGYMKMHDLLARLGREIVRKQFPNKPGKRQFLVDAGDLCQVLRNDTLDSPSVIGIDLRLSKFWTELKVSDKAFEKLSNVQFLRINSDDPESDDFDSDSDSDDELEGLKYLPPNLRFFHWDHCPMTCLPFNFNPEFLVEIQMNNSNLKILWKGTKTIRNLKCMDLRGSKKLKELPDLSTASNLRELSLSHCSSLAELPSSIGNMTNLLVLHLDGCSNLVELPSSIGNMTNLVDLRLSYSRLAELPSSIGNMTYLVKLNLEGCSNLVELPSSIGNLTNLSELILNRCPNLVELPSSIGNLHNLEELQLEGCSELYSLPINLNGSWLLKTFPEIFTNTVIDTIHDIAPLVKGMSRLKTLVIKGCTNLVSLPQLPDSLKLLHADDCESLERLDCSFNKTKFTELIFFNCFRLNQEARDLLITTSTEKLTVFPGEKVPTCFTYQATGSSLSMKSGAITHFPTNLRFRACVLLVKKGGVEAGYWRNVSICYRIKTKLDGVIVTSGGFVIKFKLYPPSKKHLFVFEFETTAASAELVVEFAFDHNKWEIEECGLCLPVPESLAPYVLQF